MDHRASDERPTRMLCVKKIAPASRTIPLITNRTTRR